MSKTKKQKAKDKADKKAAKQAAKEEAKAAEKTTETMFDTETGRNVEVKKRKFKPFNEKKAKAEYLKEPLTSVQQNRLVTLSAMIVELRTDPKTTVADLQAAIPELEKKLDELKI